MRTVRHAGSFVVSVAVAVLVWLTPAAPAGAVPGCGLDCPDPTQTFSSTLTVASPQGSVTSTPAGISCPGTCEVTDSVSTAGSVRPTAGWPTYTLSAAGGPAGYSPSWTGCGVAATCDVVNDAESKTVTLSWVDVTEPTVVFAPPARVGATALLHASGSDGAGAVSSFRWYVDHVDQGLFSSVGFSVGSVSAGVHTIGVRARDASGNESAVAEATVAVDRSVSEVVSTVSAYVAAGPTLTFSTPDIDAVTFTCSVDGGSYAPCTSPWSPPLGEGSHTLGVRATDDVGNTTTATRAFVIDQTLPVLSLTDAPFEGAMIDQSSTSVTPHQVESHPATFVCTLDAAPVACTAGSPVTLTGLAVGAHAFGITSTDQAGNIATLVRHFSRVATTKPTPTATMTAPRRAAPGKRLALRLTLQGSAGPVTGTVTWKVGRKVVCRTTLSSGRSTCRTPKLHRGRQVVVATYGGSTSYAAASARKTISVRR